MELKLVSGPNRLAVEETTGRLSLLRAGNRELLPAAHGRGPLRLHVPLPDFEAHMVEAHYTQPRVEAVSDGIRLTYPQLIGKRGPLELNAAVAITSAGDGSFELTCRIQNRSDTVIPQVFFPWISGFGTVDGTDDQVTFGHSVFKPWQAWRTAPEHLFTQYRGRPFFEMLCSDGYRAGIKWMDWGGQSCGASLFARQRDPVPQFMLVSADRFGAERLDLAWFFYPFIEPGEVWHSPNFVLYPHDGDWHHGILKFKAYADRAFQPTPSTPARDETLGQQCLWLGWNYQDWQDVPLTFRDIPAVAAEAREAGFRELTLWGTSDCFRLPHELFAPLGSAADFREALEACRDLGVNAVPIISCRLITAGSIPAGQDKNEWLAENVAGQKLADNWSYYPEMIPRLPIRQIGSYAAYYVCEGSHHWQAAYRSFLEKMRDEWGVRGVFFDQAVVTVHNTSGLCFNPLHHHRPDGQLALLTSTLIETKDYFRQRFGDEAVLIGESLWDLCTEWTDYTSDWAALGEGEPLAPFHMAFPRARQSIKTMGERAMINRIFIGGYWIELYMEEGAARLRNYPELSVYLKTLAQFKKRFARFFNRRDFYLHDMHVQVAPAEGAWVRVHVCGAEALLLVCHRDGLPAALEVSLDLERLLGAGQKRVDVWSRTLQLLQNLSGDGEISLQLELPAEDLIAVHVA